MKNNDIIGFTKTQVNLPGSTRKITRILSFFNINCNSNRNKLLGLTYGYRNNLVRLHQFNFDGVSNFSSNTNA